MRRFAAQPQGVRTALLDVDRWDLYAAEAGVYGAPEMVFYRDGLQVAHHIGAATLADRVYSPVVDADLSGGTGG